MYKMMKTICVSLLCLTLLAVTGCGAASQDAVPAPSAAESGEAPASEAAPASSEAGAEAGDITLRFTWWGADQRHEATIAALELYHEKFPNVTVEGEYGGWDGYVQKLFTQIAGGSAPDIISIPDIEAYNLINQNALEDLSDNSLVDTTVFDQNLLQKVTMNGGVFGAPGNISLDFTAIINVDFFERFNIPVDTVWDFDNLLEIGRRVHQEDPNAYLLYTSTDIMTKIGEYYIMQKNGRLMVTPEFEIQFTAEDLAEVLAMLKTYMDEGVIQSVAESSLFPGFNENPAWVNGNIGMSFDPSTTVPNYRGDGSMPLAIANMAVKKDAADPFLGSSTNMFIGINAASANKAEAGSFINWMYNDEEAIMTLQECRGTQPTEKGREILSAANIGDPLVSQAIAMAAEVGGSTPLLWVGGDEIRNIQADIYQSVLFDMATPEDAAADYLRQVEEKYAELRAAA